VVMRGLTWLLIWRIQVQGSGIPKWERAGGAAWSSRHQDQKPQRAAMSSDVSAG